MSTDIPSRMLLPQSGTPTNVDVARLLGLREPEASEVRQLLLDEGEKIRQMMTTQRRTFVARSELQPMRSETDRRLRDLLDEQQFAQYMDYRRHEAEYDRIDRLDRELTRDGEGGLSQTQRDALLAVMRAEQDAIPAPTPSQYSTQTEFQNASRAWREAYERRIQDRVAELLTPDQIARQLARR